MQVGVSLTVEIGASAGIHVRVTRFEFFRYWLSKKSCFIMKGSTAEPSRDCPACSAKQRSGMRRSI